MPDKCIYLDYNGTTPIRSEVVDEMLPYLSEHFGNPSSSHYYGQKPKDAVKKAREQICKLLGKHAKPEGLIFTGCGTEADNLAIHLAVQSFHKIRKEGVDGEKEIPHVITTSVEHPAVLEYLKYLESISEIEVTYLPVNSECLIGVDQVTKAIKPNTCFITIIYAQNEIGSLMPIGDILKQLHKSPSSEIPILFHTDAAQAIGKVPLHRIFSSSTTSATSSEERELIPDMVTIVGHKYGAPKGIAALYIHPKTGRTDILLNGGAKGLLLGGGQESGRRAGTENVPYIVALGKAADMLFESNDGFDAYTQKLEDMRSRLLNKLIFHLGDLANNDTDTTNFIKVNGPTKQRLPNTLNISLHNVNSGLLLQKLAQKVAISAGSACHSSSSSAVKISQILKEMKMDERYAMGTLRLSVGFDTTLEDIDNAACIIAGEVKGQLLGEKEYQK